MYNYVPSCPASKSLLSGHQHNLAFSFVNTIPPQKIRLERRAFQDLKFHIQHQVFNEKNKAWPFILNKKKMPTAISFPKSTETGGAGSKILI